MTTRPARSQHFVPAAPAALLTSALILGVLTTMPTSAQSSLADEHRHAAGQILGAALVDTEGWDRLTHLTTVIGPRLSGSKELEEAIEWAATGMTEDGLDHVTRQPVTVPHWVRGQESLHVVSPKPRELLMLGLGGSIATPPEGLRAPAVVVESFDELDQLGRAGVEGKIVVYAVPWNGYFSTVGYRSQGASRAARHGAVAALVRSATGSSLATPHTGGMRYAPGSNRIPAAAITVEDAEWFKRMAAAGIEVTVELKMEAETLPDAQSHNVWAEVRGTEKPEEIVLLGCHLDSWDVGQGAHDDGAACIAVWQAVKLIHDLGLEPKRTIRAVLFTNEENGLAGGVEYHRALGGDVRQHVAAIEMDGGAERPLGVGFSLPGTDGGGEDPKYEKARNLLLEIGSLLEGIEAAQVQRRGGGADISPLMRSGVPVFSLATTGENYFDWHHTEADTLDKVDPQNLRRATAILGVYGWALANLDHRLDQLP